VRNLVLPLMVSLAVALSGCSRDEGRPAEAAADSEPAPAEPEPAYPISDAGGTPATGPDGRYNHCERIWCLTHKENFFIDHFQGGHVGFVVHDDKHGDVFLPRGRTGGPAFPKSGPSALMLCGKHAHPWILGEGRRGGTPIRLTGFNHALGYGRSHFNAYGTRIDPCCVNGMGSAYVHSFAGKQFRFHELEEYRKHPEIGWQKPFAAKIEGSR
jgi:hypothetical protein